MVDDAEYITYTISTDHVNMNTQGTMCLRVNLSATVDTDMKPITAFYTSEYVAIYLINSGSTGAYYAAGGTTDNSLDSGMATSTWITIAMAWDDADGDNLAINVGDAGTWSEGWEEDTGEAFGTLNNNAASLRVGSVDGDIGDTETLYIDKWAILNTYKADCSALTGW